MALRAQVIAKSPLVLLKILVPVVIFYRVVFVMGVVTGRALLERGDAVSLVYGTALRNLSIALAIAMGAFGKAGAEAALVIAAAFIVQTQVAAWSVRFMDRLFGEAV
jgi:ACR3 family arsenite efflux pump ArsB